jgi:hypothetical protein
MKKKLVNDIFYMFGCLVMIFTVILIIFCFVACSSHKYRNTHGGKTDLNINISFLDSNLKPIKGAKNASYAYQNLILKNEIISPDLFSSKKHLSFAFSRKQVMQKLNCAGVEISLLSGGINMIYKGKVVGQFFYEDGIMVDFARINRFNRDSLMTCDVLLIFDHPKYDSSYSYNRYEIQIGTGNFSYMTRMQISNSKWKLEQLNVTHFYDIGAEQFPKRITFYPDTILSQEAYELVVNDSIYINYKYGGCQSTLRHAYKGFVSFDVLDTVLVVKNRLIETRQTILRLNNQSNYFRCSMENGYLRIVSVAREQAESEIRRKRLIRFVDFKEQM